jgi:hypothetical protein
MWSGRDNPKLSERSIPLELLEELLAVPVAWVSLQKEIRARDEEPLEVALDRGGLLHFGNQQESFADVAGIIQNLDLIITIDTGVAHLAAAMGKPTWILIPYSADWRWLENRTDSVWYPKVTLFRQERDRSWLKPLAQVKGSLQTWRSEKAF